MITDRYKNKMLKIKVIIFLAIITHSSTKVNCNEELTTELYSKKIPEDGPEARDNFSPRVDYNEWMPVGRGDPLKNDPTYDYSPPVLNRVRYWAGNADLNKYELNSNTASGVTSPISSVIGKKENNKNEILILGVPSKRQSYRKETKYQPQNTIRRSYYVVHHNLPTRLMPPPMQTIAPISVSSSNGKPTTTEAYQSNYHHQSSSGNSYMGNTATTAAMGSSHYENPTWGYNKYSYDTKLDESKKYVSITRPDVSVAQSPPSASAMIKPVQEMSVTQQSNIKRKPWIHELLEKEITPKVPISNYVSSAPTKIIHHETHLYYHHTPSTQITFTTPAYQPTEMMPTTITTERPTPAYFQPTTLPPEVTTDSLFSHYKQPEKPINGPMYLIIEGHSKVKNYGLKDNETIHMPKIRPVVMKDGDSVIKHVVLKDDYGKEIEVKHLHKSPTTTESNFHLNENLIEKDSASSVAETITNPSSHPMSNLLSLIDSSFGNFFANHDPIKEVQKNSTIEKSRNKIETKIMKDKQSSNDMIFVTTLAPENQDHKESRQIFDYDQLTESSIFDIFGGDGYYDDEENESQKDTVEPNSKYLMDKMATQEMNNDNENKNITISM